MENLPREGIEMEDLHPLLAFALILVCIVCIVWLIMVIVQFIDCLRN